jgi:hypothetical protein
VSIVFHYRLVQFACGLGPEFAWCFIHYFETGSLKREFKLAHESGAGAQYRIWNRLGASIAPPQIAPIKCRKVCRDNDTLNRSDNLRHGTINAFKLLESNFSPGPPVPL